MIFHWLKNSWEKCFWTQRQTVALLDSMIRVGEGGNDGKGPGRWRELFKNISFWVSTRFQWPPVVIIAGSVGGSGSGRWVNLKVPRFLWSGKQSRPVLCWEVGCHSRLPRYFSPVSLSFPLPLVCSAGWSRAESTNVHKAWVYLSLSLWIVSLSPSPVPAHAFFH